MQAPAPSLRDFSHIMYNTHVSQLLPTALAGETDASSVPIGVESEWHLTNPTIV
jgi:hypothetical protein